MGLFVFAVDNHDPIVTVHEGNVKITEKFVENVVHVVSS